MHFESVGTYIFGQSEGCQKQLSGCCVSYARYMMERLVYLFICVGIYVYVYYLLI
jgi:hypothetical protein